MRFAEDERGRVPFALIGVVLLVSSATFAATMAQRRRPDVTPAVGTAIEKTAAAARVAIHQSARQAANEAGRVPLIEPANTTTGQVFNGSSPFRSYLRVRVYLAARDALERVAANEGAIVATASLPETPNASALERAMGRVEIESVGDERTAGIRIRVRNVTIRASRHGRSVARRTISPVVFVASPVLALHRRTTRFEHRLNRGPLDGPGLGRRLTAQTYAIAWTRGYVQHSGVPIQNVLGNRHLELATNGALLREQRLAFGHSDPAGRRALRRATARVGITDILGATDAQGTRWAREILDERTGVDETAISTVASKAPRRSKVQLGVDRSADVGFANFVDGAGSSPSLDAVMDSVYSVDVKLTSAVRGIDEKAWMVGETPGENWTLVDERTQTDVTVEPGAGPAPAVPEEWDQLRTYSRLVTKTRTTTRRWQHGDRTRTTRRYHRSTSAVTIAMLATPAPRAHGPAAPIVGVYETGGPLDGPNLRDVPPKATTVLIDERGGPDELARRAIRGDLDTAVQTIHANQPDGLDDWIYADLARLRERTRAISVTVDRRAAVTGRRPPAHLLARRFADRRRDLVDAPSTYGSVAARARFAARAAYLDSVQEALDGRVERAATQRTNLDKSLAAVDVPSIGRIERMFAARDGTTPDRSNLSVAGIDRTISVSADAGPSYLPLSAVDGRVESSIPAGQRVHPLVARNVNVFTVPYGDVADTVVDGLFDHFDPQRTSLRTAARTLQAANRTLERADDRKLTARRDKLQNVVDASTDQIVSELASSLSDDVPTLTAAERRRAINAGVDPWATTDQKALALANETAAEPIAAALVDRLPPAKRTDRRRDWITLQVRLAIQTSVQRERVRPPQALVEKTAGRTRSTAEAVLAHAVETGVSEAVERAERRWAAKTLATIPSGLPVTPVPGYWYATVNVWQVTVRGVYPRFTVRARHGTPRFGADGANGAVAYTRTNRPVRLDVDDDGEAERIGRNTPISFESRTVVLVVVPPYGNGVGDVDGNADERSPGWPNPGPDLAPARALGPSDNP